MQTRDIPFVVFALLLPSLFLLGMCVGAYFNREVAASAGTCGSYASYTEAHAAYEAGNTHLDGDEDGIPCETLYRESL